MTARLKNILTELKSLSDKIESRQLEYQFLKQGGKIIYGIDSNIFKLFTDPLGVGGGKDNGPGFCKLFHSSDVEISGNLSVVLSHYIFKHLNLNFPLIVFDGHLREINEICNGIANTVQKVNDSVSRELSRQNDAVMEKLKKIYEETKDLDNFKHDIKSEDKIAQDLLDISAQVIEQCIIGKEIDRVNTLLDSSNPRIAGVYYLLEHHSNIFKTKYFEDNENPILKSYWKLKIEKAFLALNKDKEEDKLKHDVDTIYNLFAINRNLIETKDKLRFVLITADTNLITAAEALEPLAKKLIPKHSGSFPDLFIKHPLAFINDEDFIGGLDIQPMEPDYVKHLFSEPQEEAEQFDYKPEDFDDLASLLKMFSNYSVKNAASKNKSIGIEKYPSLVDEFIQRRLGTFSFEIKNFYGTPYDELIDKISSTQSGNEALRELYNEANSNLIKETNNLSIALQHSNVLKQETETFRYRIPPLLRFYSFPEAEQYVKSWIFDEDEQNEDTHGSRKDMYQQVLKHPNKDYFITLCNAAIWAERDNWDLVLKNSGRAIKLAMDRNALNRLPEKTLGHEAAYLYVVAKRHLASAKSKKEAEKLKTDIEMMLFYAKRLWNKYWDNNEDPDTKIENANNEYRFKHEEYSIELMDIWYDLFYFNRKNHSELQNERNKKRLIAVKDDLYNIIETTQSQLLDETDNRISDYLRYAQRHALNNFCLIYIVLENHPNFLCQQPAEPIKNVLLIYKNSSTINRRNFKVKSYLHKVVMGISSLLFDEMETSERKKLRASMMELLSPSEYAKFSKKSYEKGRYEFLSNIANDKSSSEPHSYFKHY